MDQYKFQATLKVYSKLMKIWKRVNQKAVFSDAGQSGILMKKA